MLDVECFTYLNKALESPISPIVVLASNRGMATIRGADDLVAAHGIPPDFLSRLLIIPTHPYEPDEIKRIVRIRANTEGVHLTDAAIDRIADHGVRISLRYCLQLLAPARYVFFFVFVSDARSGIWRNCVWLTRRTVSFPASMVAL
jgi:RuvB-like protein 1 (pontin 52)